jgi:hypothetical protein
MSQGQDFRNYSAASLQIQIWTQIQVLRFEEGLQPRSEDEDLLCCASSVIAWRGSESSPKPWSPILIRSNAKSGPHRAPNIGRVSISTNRNSEPSRC